MNFNNLVNEIKSKQSFLCIGLDTDKKKIPEFLLNKQDPIFEFNKQIIDATHQYSIAYKPNIAFYENEGVEGWISLQKTIKYLKEEYPKIFVIADAKRGDIGNTSDMYASAFLEKMNFDAITVAPYMGEDSVTPFLKYQDKWVILLALTSNKGAFDFQFNSDNNNKRLFEQVITKSSNWADEKKMMYVVGATKAEMLGDIRKLIPNHFLLVPGIGAQGGSLSEVAKYGITHNCGLIVNSSRDIIYAGQSEGFAEQAKIKAEKVQLEMKDILMEYKII